MKSYWEQLDDHNEMIRQELYNKPVFFTTKEKEEKYIEKWLKYEEQSSSSDQ